MVLGGDGIGDARDAEATWKGILDSVFKPRGEGLLQRFDTELAKLPDMETDLRNQLADYRAKADAMWPELAPLHQILKDEITEQRGKSNDEFAYADALCTNDAMARLCEFVACGYSPDYTGIATRARADAELAAQNTFEQMCRIGNRYNMRRTQHSLTEIRMTTMSAAIGATSPTTCGRTSSRMPTRR